MKTKLIYLYLLGGLACLLFTQPAAAGVSTLREDRGTTPSLTPPSDPSPADGATGIDFQSDLTLSWSADGDASMQEVRLWQEGDDRPTTPSFSGSATGSVEVTNLEEFTLYMWEVTSFLGMDEAAGPTWTFRTNARQPDFPVVTFPPSSSRDIPFHDLEITWQPPDPGDPPITSYNIYLGLSQEFGSNPPRIGSTNQTSFVVPFDLEPARGYNLRVEAVGPGGTNSLPTPRSFETAATIDPVNIYYYIAKDEMVNGTRHLTWAVQLLDNPSQVVVGTYSFIAEWDPSVLTQLNFIPPPNSFQPKLNLPVNVSTNNLPPNQASISGLTLNNSTPEGFMFLVEAEVAGTLQENPLPLTFFDNPNAESGMTSDGVGATIDHVFVGSLDEPAPEPPVLVEPADGAFFDVLDVTLMWDWSNFNNGDFGIWIWDSAEPRPADPFFSGSYSLFFDGEVLKLRVRDPILENGVTYNWQISADNFSGERAFSETRSFTVMLPPTPTPTMTPTMTMTPTPTTTPTETPTPTPSPSPTPTPTPEPTAPTPTPGTPTPTATPSPTESPTPSPTPTPTPTASPSSPPTPTPTATPTPTITPAPSPTPTPDTAVEDIVAFLLGDVLGGIPEPNNGVPPIDSADIVFVQLQ